MSYLREFQIFLYSYEFFFFLLIEIRNEMDSESVYILMW